MKRLRDFFIIGLVFLTVLPLCSVWGQTPAKKAPPEVPVTYPGDTDKTIMRRAQWIEEAKKEGTLDWWGISRPEEANRIIVEFNKVYPFIKVVYWRGQGEEIAAKLEAEYIGRRYSVDVALGAEPSNIPRWAKMGIIEKFIDTVPGIERFDKRMYGKRGDWVVPAFAPKVPQYNTNLVSAAEAPKSWEDLLNPKWKGQLGAEVEPSNWAALALAEGGWGIEKTEDFLAKLKEQKPRFIQGGSTAHSLLLAGDFKIMTSGNLRYVIISQAKKAPAEWVRVNPILIDFAPPLYLFTKSPHPYAARLFLEWMLSHLGQMVFAEVSQNYVPGVATPIAKLLEGRPLVVETEEVMQKINDMGLIKKFNKILYGIEN